MSMTPTWGVGILTWNDPLQCLETLQALQAQLQGREDYTTYVLDNGSGYPPKTDTAHVILQPTNLGAGGGLSALIREMLHGNHEYVLFLEDDWVLQRWLSLVDLELFLDNAVAGQVRLAERARHPSDKYWTYGLTDPEEVAQALSQRTDQRGQYVDGTYHRGRFFWSSNPFACTYTVAERFLLDGLHELALGRPYYDADLATITTFPGYFKHVGEVRARRERLGWQK